MGFWFNIIHCFYRSSHNHLDYEHATLVTRYLASSRSFSKSFDAYLSQVQYFVATMQSVIWASFKIKQSASNWIPVPLTRKSCVKVMMTILLNCSNHFFCHYAYKYCRSSECLMKVLLQSEPRQWSHCQLLFLLTHLSFLG